jgi:hypothetical protein
MRRASPWTPLRMIPAPLRTTRDHRAASLPLQIDLNTRKFILRVLSRRVLFPSLKAVVRSNGDAPGYLDRR